MRVTDFVNPLKFNPTLIGKPKLCFFQACRGGERLDGWRIKSGVLRESAKKEILNFAEKGWPLGIKPFLNL